MLVSRKTEQVDQTLVFTLKKLERAKKEREQKKENTFVCTKSQTKYFIAFTINESVKRENGEKKEE